MTTYLALALAALLFVLARVGAASDDLPLLALAVLFWWLPKPNGKRKSILWLLGAACFLLPWPFNGFDLAALALALWAVFH